MTSVTAETAVEFGRAADELLFGLMRRDDVRDELAAAPVSATAWAAVRDAGWHEVILPEDAGGLGLGLPELGALFMAAGRHLLPGPLLESAVVAPLLGLDGEVAMVDPAALGAQELEPGPDGGLTGGVAGVCFAASADVIAVVAGESVVLLNAGDAGVEIVPQEVLDVTVQAAAVSLDGAVGRPLPGADVARLRDVQRLMIACELSGIAQHALEIAVEYAKQREQFDRPIGAFQAVQHILAEMDRRSVGLAALCRESLEAAERTPEALPTIARVAKAHAARAAREVVEDSLQVHGGIAFTIEHELHRYYKRTLALEPLYGGSRALARDIARSLLEGGDPWPIW